MLQLQVSQKIKFIKPNFKLERVSVPKQKSKHAYETQHEIGQRHEKPNGHDQTGRRGNHHQLKTPETQQGDEPRITTALIRQTIILGGRRCEIDTFS